MERRTVLKLLGASAAAACRPALAKSAYPSHTISMFVGSAPGSATDLAGRLAADAMKSHYKQSVIVENKPGAGGIVCMIHVAAAAPDGYTLQTGGLGNNVIPPVTRTGLPIDIPKAIMPIAQLAEFVNVLVVRANHPANNLQELIAYYKSRARPVIYGSNGIGTSSHLTSELFGIQTGLKMHHIPYRVSTDALIGAANGDLDLLFMNLPPALPIIQSKQLKALAVTSSYRIHQLPNVPTMQEQGMKEFDVTSWLGVYGPAGIPADIVKSISDVLTKDLDTPQYRQRFVNAGFVPKLRGTAEFTAYNEAELKRWGAVAKTAGISIPYGKS